MNPVSKLDYEEVYVTVDLVELSIKKNDLIT